MCDHSRDWRLPSRLWAWLTTSATNPGALTTRVDPSTDQNYGVRPDDYSFGRTATSSPRIASPARSDQDVDFTRGTGEPVPTLAKRHRHFHAELRPTSDFEGPSLPPRRLYFDEPRHRRPDRGSQPVPPLANLLCRRQPGTQNVNSLEATFSALTGQAESDRKFSRRQGFFNNIARTTRHLFLRQRRLRVPPASC